MRVGSKPPTVCRTPPREVRREGESASSEFERVRDSPLRERSEGRVRAPVWTFSARYAARMIWFKVSGLGVGVCG